MSAAPSAWVVEFASCVPPGRPVLDVACGKGRNLRHFLDREHPVVGVDRDLSQLGDLAGRPDVELWRLDLETDPPASLGDSRFGGVVVTNYLHRPLFPSILDAIEPGGVLIYETFAAGNERLGRPRNPEFLLAPNELVQMLDGRFAVIDFGQWRREVPSPAILQHICARRET